MSLSTLQQEWANSYLSGGNAAYVDGLYEDYLQNPATVPVEWRAVFDALPRVSDQPELSHRAVQDYFLEAARHPRNNGTVVVSPNQQSATDLIQAYRTYGHHQARLDPLEMAPRRSHPMLDSAYYHLTDAARKETYSAGPYFGTTAHISG